MPIMFMRILRTRNNSPLFAMALAFALSPAFSFADDTVAVEFDTSEGKFVIELDAAKAPKTVENFLQYVSNGYYDGTVFHRVIRDFMVQGGGFDQSLKEKKTGPPVRNEAESLQGRSIWLRPDHRVSV